VKRYTVFWMLLMALVVMPRTAVRAMPYFSYQYGYSCTQCHSTVPILSPFGKAFKFAGYRLPGLSPAHRVLPIATQNSILHTTSVDATGLPKTIEDYAELNSAGPIGKAFDYFALAYVVDGGRPGALHDAWIEYSSGVANPDARQDLRLKVGLFYLPLPASAETYRETLNHYAAFDQTIGSNPFKFSDSHIGLDASIGAQYFGSNLHLIVTQGHDFQSGLPEARPDVMLYGEHNTKDLTIAAYALDGERDVHAPRVDKFERVGSAATVRRGKAEVTMLLQSGWDSSSDSNGNGQRANAGFGQLRWGFSPALTGLLRQDGTNDDTSIRRTTTAALIVRTHANSKFVIEGIFGPAPTLNMEFFVAN